MRMEFKPRSVWLQNLYLLGLLLLIYLLLLITLESPLDCTEIKPVNPKGNQSWIFIGRTDAEAEAPILWPSDAKSQLIGKDPDAGQDWGQEEEGMTEDEMDGITNSMDMSLSKVLEIVKDRGAWCAAVLRVANNRTWLSDWTELKNNSGFDFFTKKFQYHILLRTHFIFLKFWRGQFSYYIPASSVAIKKIWDYNYFVFLVYFSILFFVL